MNANMNILKDLLLKSKKEVYKCLLEKSDKELFELFKYIIEDNPFLYETAIEFIVNRLYSDNETFAKLLCELIETTSYDLVFGKIFELIKEIVLKQRRKTLALTKKMINLRIGTGVCSGILISPLLGQNVVDKEIISHLKSNDSFLQRHSLTAIYEFLITNNREDAKFFIEKLIEVAEDIDEDDTDLLIQCLVNAFLIDRDSVSPVLEKEIERRGYPAATTYVHKVLLYRKKFPVSLLKTAVQIIETETPENEIIDNALAQIYEEDRNFVVEWLRERLYEGRVPLAEDMLIYTIQNTDYYTVIQMLEEEIDNENPTMIYIGENILEDIFPSKEEWLEWCKKWKDDERKKDVVLRSLAKILSGLINYQPSPIRDEAIAIVKEFAEKEGLNYEEETKSLDYGSDPHKGAEHKENTIKALYLIKKLLYLSIKIDASILKENLKNYPYLSKAIDANFLIKSAKSKHPHPLALLYGKKVDYNKMNKLLKKLESEKDEYKKLQIALQYDSLARLAIEQKYWEQVFKTLDEHGLKIPKGKLQGIDNAESILVEAEVIARLAPYFKVEIEPKIPEFGPKELDAKIKFNGQEALIEIRLVKEKTEFKVAHGVVVSTPGGKVKKALLNKFKEQLKEGKVDPKMPVILVLCLDTGLDYLDAENAIYGQLQFQFKIRKDTRQIVEKGIIRKSNSFYEIEDTDIVTAIAVYKRDYTRKDPLIGRLYRPPPSIVPRNPMSREFRVRLRNALFGESENSYWQSLLKIEGINEDIAKKLYAEGIEDLEALAMAAEEDLKIQGFNMQEMKRLQQEAQRIIKALLTNSIRFLKGVNQHIYDILVKNKIHLIKQVLELDEIPEGIDPTVWKKINEDARKIMG